MSNPASDAIYDFVEQSYLTYVVPSRTDIDLDQTFKDADASRSIPEALPQRDSLFFDETVEVVLILRMPWSEEGALQAQIKRLVISLEAQIVNTTTGSSAADRSDAQPATETIFKGHVSDVADPFIIVDQEESDSEDESWQNVYAMWKMPVFLARAPRTRLQQPAVVFSASASLTPQEAEATAGDMTTTARLPTGYLESGVPSSRNLLQSFSSDPALRGVKPRLSALRVSRVAPVTRQQDLVVHLRALPQLRIPIHPVVNARVRLSRPPSVPPQTTTLMALLELDFTHHAACEMLLHDMTLSTDEGTVRSLDDELAPDTRMKLPMSCVAHDHITFLYRIRPHQQHGIRSHKSFTGRLDVSLSVTAQILPGVCTPRLTMSWSTTLDFTPPVNPSFNIMADSTTGIQRANKPSQLSITNNHTLHPNNNPSTHLRPSLPLHPQSLESPFPSPALPDLTPSDLGITMSFTAPSHPIHPGDLFSWTIHVLNRSPEPAARPPRKLALLALPKRRRNDTRPARPPSTASRRAGEKPLAHAVLDTNVLHALQRNSLPDFPEVICLSADTRVGPLAPGTCHVVEMQFLALREGIVGVEAVRVVDLASQEHVDIRDLPTTIVEPVGA